MPTVHREPVERPDITINLGPAEVLIYVLKPEDTPPAGTQITACIQHPELRLAWLAIPKKGDTNVTLQRLTLPTTYPYLN